MTREDKRQQELPYGAAQGTYDERRLKVGMTIGAMFDPKTGALLEPYAGAPVMELRVLMLLMLEAEARGRSLTSEDMTGPPWGLLCSERTVRRVLKLGLDLGILLSERRLAGDRQKFVKAWRIDWQGILRFVGVRAGPNGHGGQASGHRGQASGHRGQARSSYSSCLNKDLDVVDDVFGDKASTEREGDWPLWPDEPREATGRDRGCIGAPESAKPTPHEGAAATRLVSCGPRRAESIDATRLVGLVRQCGVYAAEQAVSSAIRHGHDVPALVAGWRTYCLPGWEDKNEAAKRLYYRLIDPPMGLEPHEGWVVQHPHRIRLPESAQIAEQRQHAEIKRRAATEAEKSQLLKAKRWLQSLEKAQAQAVLEEFYSDSAAIVTTTVRKDHNPLENGLFLLWVLRRYGAKLQ